MRMDSGYCKSGWLIGLLVVVVSVCGCGRKETVDVLLTGPEAGQLAAAPEFSARAFEASGGADAWAERQRVDFEGVVTLYQRDGSFYLTEQRYEVYPWSGAIVVSGTEPGGDFVCRLTRSGFEVPVGSEALSGLPSGVRPRDLADCVLNIASVAATLVDSSYEYMRLNEPARIDGQWYDLIDRSYKVEEAPAAKRKGRGDERERYWSRVVLRQNRDTHLVSMIWFGRAGMQQLLVRGYDYEEVAKGDVLIPTKIEIFTTDSSGGSARRAVKIDVK